MRCVVRSTLKTPQMIKTLSLSVLFFLTLGVMFAAYASVPAGL